MYLSHKNYKEIDYPHYVIITFDYANEDDGWGGTSTTYYPVYDVYEESKKSDWERDVGVLVIDKKEHIAMHVDKIYKPKIKVALSWE
jgi:hypothetical protein|tara:strand:- start:1050 stop:1310 length:261 start_codon:yes stop_codon:yes gene_type:complete